MTALSVAGSILGVAEASADDSGTSSAGAYVDQDDRPTAVASGGSIVTARGRSVGGGTGDDNCEWVAVVEDDRAFAVFDVDGTREFSPTGRWFERTCDGEKVAVGSSFAVPQGVPAPAVDPAVLAAQARESVQVAAPMIETSPAADRRLYTQVPTWLWLAGEWWRPYSATATAGGVSATVTATPVRAMWTTGDGGVVSCNEPGVAWRPGLTEDASDCRHVYRHSSAGQPSGAYELSVAVEFDVAWTSSVGAGGVLAGITRTASRPVAVGEIQAIETG